MNAPMSAPKPADSPTPVDLGEIKRLLSEARLPDVMTFLDLGEVVGPDDRIVAIVPAQESFDARGELIAAALTNLAALIAELEAKTEALEKIASHTDDGDPDSYRADDREGCLDAVYAIATGALGAKP